VHSPHESRSRSAQPPGKEGTQSKTLSHAATREEDVGQVVGGHTHSWQVGAVLAAPVKLVTHHHLQERSVAC
jgi:hypothetical protein